MHSSLVTRLVYFSTGLAGLVLFATPPSDIIAYSFTGGFPSVAALVTAGHRFTTIEPILVTSLGVFDSHEPGLSDSHDIGLWTDNGTLLTSTTVPAGAGATLTGGFRFVPIDPVMLAAGATYRLGAFFPTFFDGFISNVTFTTAPEISLEQSSYTSGLVGSLTFPALPGNAAGNALANFAFRVSLELDVDIKPGSERNPVNPRSKGVVPVAILGSDAFDVGNIDVTTLSFGSNGATPVDPGGGHLEDVNSDGFLDLVSHYSVPSTGISPGDQSACVTAQTLDGTPLNGCDAIVTVPR